MQTNLLKRTHPNKKRMIVARGGKRGKTAGRGGKGQSARAGNKRRPEWRDIIKRLPKLRGRGKNSNKTAKNVFQKPVAVNLRSIEAAFKSGGAVTPATLIENGVVSTWSGRVPMVKILGDGEITKAIEVSGCGVSASAKAAIEKAGGSVVPLKPEAPAPEVRQAPEKPAATEAPAKKAPAKKKPAPAKK